MPKIQPELVPSEIFIPTFSIKVWVYFANFRLNSLLQCGGVEAIVKFHVITTLDENEAEVGAMTVFGADEIGAFFVSCDPSVPAEGTVYVSTGEMFRCGVTVISFDFKRDYFHWYETILFFVLNMTGV